MIISSAVSKNGIKIRLTEERWLHVTYSHKEIDITDFDEAIVSKRGAPGNPAGVLTFAIFV